MAAGVALSASAASSVRINPARFAVAAAGVRAAGAAAGTGAADDERDAAVAADRGTNGSSMDDKPKSTVVSIICSRSEILWH